MPKKILFFYQSPEVGGGVDTVLINLIRTWPQKDDRLEVWLNQGHKGRHLYDRMGIAVRQIRLVGIFGPLKHVYFLYAIAVFFQELKQARPEVVFSHNGGYPGGQLNLAFVLAARLAGVKKVFLVVHNNARPLGPPLAFLNRILDKMVDASCTRIISVSASCAGQIQRARFPDGKKVDFVYNGIMMEKSGQSSLSGKRKKLGLEGDCKVIGSIGDYEERKGHEYLLRAFAMLQNEFPDLKLVLIGSDRSPHALCLKKLIEELNLDRKVFLTGYLDAAWEYIECFDIFVFPSIAYESFGMVLLEAMLYKKPVIATNVGGIPEVLGNTGIIVEPQNAGQLANAVKGLLNNQELSGDRQEEGYNRLKNEFQAQRMAQKYYAYTCQ